MRRKLCPIFFLLLPLLLAMPVMAQFSQRGSIGGVVTDASGAVVPQASVTLLDVQRNQTTVQTTNAAGRYEFRKYFRAPIRSQSKLPGSTRLCLNP